MKTEYGKSDYFVLLCTQFETPKNLTRMKIINLSETNSVLNKYLAEIRDINVQNDRLRFRRNIERIGEIMAYEISKSFDYSDKEVQTPLDKATVSTHNNQLVINTILRAGLPFHSGFLSYFDDAENAFVSAYRKYKDKLKFDVHVEYLASPRIDGKTLIMTDPMLATGSSMELGYKAMLNRGLPKDVHVACIIASQQAVDYIAKVFPEATTTIWCAAIDPVINDHSYIVPGLGDVGDLAFGEKI